MDRREAIEELRRIGGSAMAGGELPPPPGEPSPLLLARLVRHSFQRAAMLRDHGMTIRVEGAVEALLAPAATEGDLPEVWIGFAGDRPYISKSPTVLGESGPVAHRYVPAEP